MCSSGCDRAATDDMLSHRVAARQGQLSLAVAVEAFGERFESGGAVCGDRAGEGARGAHERARCAQVAERGGRGDAVPQVFLEELEREGLERLGGGGDLGEYVDAVD
ncbi:hypothetical protein ADL26_16675, partial [Thermoactinomyces vulgaris]